MAPAGVEPVSPDAPGLTGRVMMTQRWRDLTFLHWAVDPGLVASRMPPGVRPDTLDGVTYVGLIPFRMVGAGFAVGPVSRIASACAAAGFASTETATSAAFSPFGR